MLVKKFWMYEYLPTFCSIYSIFYTNIGISTFKILYAFLIKRFEKQDATFIKNHSPGTKVHLSPPPSESSGPPGNSAESET